MSRTATTATARTAGNWQGMNWIRQEKRLAIYLRDGLACVYCQHSAESGAALSLDHVKPHSKGGSNSETNLVTCCTRCNSSRGDRSLTTFAKVVTAYTDNGTTAADILRAVRNQTARKLAPYKLEAAALIARRGSSAKALSKLS